MPGDIKQQPNRRLYIETLRRMTPEERLMKALELGEMSRELTRRGLRERFPDAPDEEIRRLFLERLERCRNRTF